MNDNAEFERDKVSENLFKIYTVSKAPLLRQLESIIVPYATQLADFFYTNMLSIPESQPYLNHQIVSDRLHRSMAEWIGDLFLPNDELTVSEYMKRQQTIGLVHARINVPMKLVNHGIRLLKTEIGRILFASDLEDPQRYQGLLLVNSLLDYSSAFINESYLIHQMDNENVTQAYRMNMINLSLVVELERLRSSLFDWLRKMIVAIYEKYPEEYPNLTSIYYSDFGLWATFKAEFLFSDHPELIGKLKNHLDNIQNCLDRINGLIGVDTREQLLITIENLNENVTQAAWLIGNFASQTYEMEAGRDPLTRLLNRRFLPAVMQNMIKATRSSLSNFSVLSCDLNEFKKINDQYGHDTGDKALIAFGEFLASQVRATDYVFRLGGDEFLLIVAGADSRVAVNVAMKILNQLKNKNFNLGNEILMSIGTSIGIVEFDGHPDYLRLLNKADEALYKAKSVGTDQYYCIPAVESTHSIRKSEDPHNSESRTLSPA